jgi:uncharacterized protein with NRDE domain
VCLLVVAFRVVADTPLLVGANRDEKLARPTTVLTALNKRNPRILGGRDEHSGGTWLAVNQHGVVAALTNQPLGDAKDLTKRSRGELPLAMAHEPTAARAAERLLQQHRPDDFNGSWLLVGDRTSLFFIDFTGLVEPTAVALPPGVHVLENKALGAPSVKTTRTLELLTELDADPGRATATLERALGDHCLPEQVMPADDEAPRVVPNCVHLEEYGTRSACTLRIGASAGACPILRVADGPPCTTPFVDLSAWWAGDPS